MIGTVKRRLMRVDRLQDADRVAVRGVDDQEIDVLLDQRRGPLFGVGADPDRRADPQPALGVLGRVRELDLLLDVLDRDQPGQIAVLVDDRQLFDPVPVQDLAGLFERGADRRR